MYNRYISPQDDGIPSPGNEEDASPKKEGVKGFAQLKNLLGDKIKLPELNTDTILLLVLAYFLVSDGDGEKPQSDTLLILGALLLLGF